MGNWTGDGRYFLFQIDGGPGRGLWALPETQGNRYDPDRRGVQLTNGPISFDSPVAAQDGKKLFAVGRFQRGELMRMDAKSRRFVPWLNGLSAEGLTFSADGESVAYTLFPEQTLWRSRADGSQRVQLSFSGLHAMLPRWSPDGQRIAFMGRPPGDRGHWNIYVVPVAGGSPEALLASDTDYAGPSWSPDGKSLAFAGAPWLKSFAKESTAIRVTDLRTRQVSVVPGSEGLWAPKWSPDGRYILAETVDSQELKLFDFESRQWKSLTRTGETIGYPVWSRAGGSVYFNTAARALYRVELRDGKVERVFSLGDLKMVGQFGPWFGLMPDDTPIVLRDTSVQEVYALDVELP
jgi:Tol biopolymer transport system component